MHGNFAAGELIENASHCVHVQMMVMDGHDYVWPQMFFAQIVDNLLENVIDIFNGIDDCDWEGKVGQNC